MFAPWEWDLTIQNGRDLMLLLQHMSRIRAVTAAHATDLDISVSDSILMKVRNAEQSVS